MEQETTAKLGRQDWLDIGLQTLVKKGIDAVRIDPLAKMLKVTRGSFYWHFKNHDELLMAMLKEWETKSTKRIIKEIEAIEDKPNVKLLSLFELAAQDDNQLEKAMRVWGANDDRAAAAITRIDEQRLEYLQSLFLQLGFSAMDAQVRAQVAYSFRLGWFIISSSKHPAERLAEIRLVHEMLTQIDGVKAIL
jgi:AcrR family transcriptional regulator